MGHFKFLHGSRMTCFPFNISEKLHWQHLFEKLREIALIAFIFFNTNAHSEEQYQPLKKGVGTPFFYSYTKPAPGWVLVHFTDKTHVLVVTLNLIWLLFLNILSLNLVQTPNKSLRFKRFRRSYVNCPIVVPATVKIPLLFLFHVCYLNWPNSLLVPSDSAFA